jgi:hypothetical protein
MKYSITFFSFFLFCNFAIAQNREHVNLNCKIDSINFKEFSLSYIYEKRSFKDPDSMGFFGKPWKNWTSIYQKGRIVKRLLGNTFGGQNRVQNFHYKEDKLIKITDNGSMANGYQFEYDVTNLPIKYNITNAILGNKKYNIKTNDNIIFFTYTSNETGQEITDSIDINSPLYALNTKYGNIEFLDDELDFATYNYFEDPLYKIEVQKDKCNNTIRVIKTIVETKVIMELQLYKYYYSN